jgi:hypothetical protein
MSILVRNQFMPGRYNNYLIAGNICNAFALGEIGSHDDFFLIGAEPEDESNYPLLSGNILDSEGNVLFRLVRNVLAINPGHCSRILGDHIGYEIHDSAGNLIFKVKTSFEKLPNKDEESFVTTITSNFYNKDRQLVFSANSGEPNERIESHVKSAFGFSGGFGLVQGMDQQELDFTRLVLTTRGAIHQLISNDIVGEEVQLDGKMLFNARLSNCTVHVKTGQFSTYGQCGFENCKFVFHDAAENIRQLILALSKQKQP